MANTRSLYANKKVAIIDALIVLAFIAILAYTNHNLNAASSNVSVINARQTNQPAVAKQKSEDYKKYILQGFVRVHN